MPVCITINWATVNGLIIMFVDPTSKVVDHRIIDKFLDDNCSPRYDNNTRLARTNSWNFHHAINASLEKMKKSSESI